MGLTMVSTELNFGLVDSLTARAIKTTFQAKAFFPIEKVRIEAVAAKVVNGEVRDIPLTCLADRACGDEQYTYLCLMVRGAILFFG